MSPFPPKPAALPVLPDSMPVGMRARSQWVVWRYKLNPKKTKPWTKVPYDPKRGDNASTATRAPGGRSRRLSPSIKRWL